MENQNGMTTPRQSKKGLVGLAVIAVVLFVAALGLGTAYFFEMEQVGGLQRRVDELKTSVARMDEEMAKDANAKLAAPAVKYREIPELGVKYKLTAETRSLTYSYEEREGISMALFSTVELVRIKNSEGLHPCSQGSSGMIVRYKEEPKVREGTTVKKIDGNYFVYTPPQNSCEIDGVMAPGLTESTATAGRAFSSLEAM